jgi:predicted anti-sigma-YlaC factor YlaD
MGDLDDPRISAYKRQRRLAPVAPPPGSHRRESKAQRERERKLQAREARWLGASNAGVIIMGVVLAVVVAMLVVVLIGHH